MLRLLLLVHLWMPFWAIAQSDEADQRRFATLMQKAQQEQWHALAFGELVQRVGLEFRGTEYVAGILDAPDEETLLAPLTRFDCVLFVESVLALARGIAAQDYSWASYLAHVQQQRYRDGVKDGYCSRLHYFSDWLHNNEERNLVVQLTQGLGGVPLGKPINFMSRNRSAYRHLASDSLFSGIVAVEQALRDRETFYIPKTRIRATYSGLQAGDVVALTSDLAGLDVAHTGFVFVGADGQIGLLHASTQRGVVVEPDLHAYVQGVRRQNGVMIARPNPRN